MENTELDAQENLEEVKEPINVDNDPKTPLTKDEQAIVDSYAKTILTSYAKPATAEAMVNKDTFIEIYGEKFIEAYKGNKNKAYSAIDQQYELISKRYQEQASEESDFKMLESISFMAEGASDIEFIGDNYAPVIYTAPATMSGRKEMLDNWTDPTRTIEQASLLNKKVIDYAGNIIDYDEDAYAELVDNDTYANTEGKNIIAFTYLPYDEYSRNTNAGIKAVYEGELPDGEVVSRHDTKNDFLSNNGLEASSWKVGVGSVYDFIIDSVDTAVALGQYAILGATLGNAADTDMYKNIVDFRTSLSTNMMSKSQADKESFFTFNNALNLGINIAGQLLTGKAIAKGMSKMLNVGIKSSENIFKTKIALEEAITAATSPALAGTAKTLAKKEVKRLQKLFDYKNKIYNTKANIVKGTTLAFMSAMQAKATGDEAAKLGFTPAEQAAIFFSSLGTMMLANSISDLGFEKLGLRSIHPTLQRSAKESISGISPGATGVVNIFKKTKDIAINTRHRLEQALSGSGIVGSGIREGVQEETEYVFDEVVRHAVTALKSLGQDVDPPAFKTMMDEGYWENFGLESLMNISVGAIAGAGSHAVSGGLRRKNTPDHELPSFQKGKAAEVFKTVAYYSTRSPQGSQWETQLLKSFKTERKRGAQGREDISTKWDSKNKRYKRTNELTAADKSAGHLSQAEAQYKAVMYQYQYYKHIFKTSTEQLDKLKAQNPEFGFIMDNQTMYEETKALLDKKAEINSRSASGGSIDIDSNLKELAKEQDKVKFNKDKKSTSDVYNSKLADLSKVTKLAPKEIEELVAINEQLDDISTGKALEISFIKYQMNTSKYKDRLPFDTFQNLIDSDRHAQQTYTEDNKIYINHQKQNNDAATNGIDEKGDLTEAFVDDLLQNSTGILLSEKNQSAIRASIAGMGVNLHQQKQKIYAKILPNLHTSLQEAINEEDSFADYNDMKEGNDLAHEFVQALEYATTIDDNAINKVIKDYTDLVILENKSTVKLGYNLKKILDVASITSPEGFKNIRYTPEDSSIFEETSTGKSQIRNAIEQSLADTRQGMGMASLIRTTFTTESSSALLSELFSEDPNVDFLNILDPYKSTKKLFNKATKDELNEIITKSSEYIPVKIRPDLFHGFVSTADNGIQANNMNLDQQYELLISGLDTKDGKVTFFSDAAAAQKYTSQVDTRLAEVEFLLEFLPTLYELNYLNNTTLNNKSPKSAFLTTYVEEFLIPFDEYKKNPAKIINYLEAIKSKLKVAKEKGDHLIALSENASEDLHKTYSEQAVLKAHKDLKDNIYAILTSTGFEKVRDIPLYKDTLDSIVAKINTISDSNIADIYETVTYTKKALNNLYKETKDTNGNSAFLEAIKNAYTDNWPTEKYEKLILYTLSDSEELNGLLKEVLTQPFTEAKDDTALMHVLKLPTAGQLAWIEAMVIASTEKEFLPTMAYIKNKNNGSKIFTSAAFFNGRQGAGKTQVILKYASDIIHAINIRRNDTNFKGILLAADKPSQRANMLRNTNPRILREVSSKHITDQYDLYNLLVNTDLSISQLNDVLADISTIFYDEVTKIEYSGLDEDVALARTSPKDAPVLDAILAQLEAINEFRKNDPIVLIGIGDSTQPGFLVGSPSPRNNTTIDDNVVLSGRSTHALNRGNTYRNSDKLLNNFRSEVLGMADSIEDFQTSMTQRKAPIEFKYDNNDNNHRGIKIDGGEFSTLANNKDLMDDIDRKMESDKDFTVTIVAGLNKVNEDLLTQLVDGKKTLLSEKIEKFKGRITVTSLNDVQGSEANYLLIHLPKDFFILSKEQLTSKSLIDTTNKAIFSSRVTYFKTALGRAQTYAHVSYGGDLFGTLIKSAPHNLEVKAPKMNADFKLNWGNALLNNILNTEKQITTKLIPDDIIIEDTKLSSKNSTESELNLYPLINTAQYIPMESSEALMSETTTTSQAKIRQDIASNIEIIAREYNHDVSDMSEGSIKALKTAIKEVITIQDTPQSDSKIIKAKENLHKLNNIKETILEIDTNEDIQQDIASIISSDETNVNDRGDTTARAFMVNEEVNNRKVVAYQDFQSEKRHENPKTLRNRNNTQVYGNNSMPITDRDGAIASALTFDKNNKAKLNTNKYDYYVVTYKGNFTGSTKKDWKSNVLVGKPKNDPNNAFFIATFPDATNFAEIDNSIGSFLKERLNRLDADTAEKDPTIKTTVYVGGEGVYKDKEYVTKYIESKIDDKNVNSIITSRTVGNLVTTDPFILNVLKRSEILPNVSTLQEGKLFKGVVKDYAFINKLKTYKKSGVITIDEGIDANTDSDKYETPFWNEDTFKGKTRFVGGNNPFMSFADNTKLIRKISETGQYYTTIKTTRGNVPFLLDGFSSAIPIVGVHNEVLVLGKNLIDASHDNFNKEISIIADELRGLIPESSEDIPKDYNRLIGEITADKLQIDIEVILDSNLQLSSELSEDSAQRKFLSDFIKKSELYLGNIKLPLNKAKKLFELTGGASSYSKPYVLTRGKHAGKAVLFYTSNDNMDLDAYTDSDMITLYKKMIINKNNNISNFSDNRLGVGMLLLDVKGFNFSELLDLLPEASLSKLNAVNVNKAVMSKHSETKIIELFASLYKAINKNNHETKNIVEELHNSELTDVVDSWHAAKSNTKEFNILVDMLHHIFDSESLGKIVVTHNINEQVVSVLHQAKDILTRSNIDHDTELQNLYTEFDTVLQSAKITEYRQLKNIVLRDDTSTGVDGFLVLNSDGKAVLQKSKFSVITAMDTNWVRNMSGNPEDMSIIAPPTFNMYKFLEILNALTKHDVAEVKAVLALLDPLLNSIGLTEGMFISPTISMTSDPISAVKTTIYEDEDSIYLTDVKRIRKPQLVFNVDALIMPGAITDMTTEVIKNVETEIKNQNIVQDISTKISTAKTLPNFNFILSLIETGVKLKTLNDVESTDLYNMVVDQYSNVFKLKTNFEDVDFNTSILAIPGTENFIRTFNILRDLSLNSDLKEFIWNDLIEYPSDFNNAQKTRLNAILQLPSKDVTDIEAVFKTTSKFFKNKALSTLSLRTDNEDFINNVAIIKSGITQLEYPVALDLSPEDRVSLLLGLNTVNAITGDKLISVADTESTAIDQAFRYNPTTITSKKLINNWARNSLDLTKLSRGVTTEAINQVLTSADTNVNILSLKPTQIRATLQTLFKQGNFQKYQELLYEIYIDIKGIYYNKENKILANESILTTLSRVPDALQVTQIKEEIHNYNLQLMGDIIIDEATTLQNIFTNSVEVKTLKKENFVAGKALDTVLETITEEESSVLNKYITQDFTQTEKDTAVVETVEAMVVQMVINKSNTTDPTILKKVIDVMELLANKEEFNCFV